MTVGDLVKYILAHRKGNAFKNHTEPEVVHEVSVAIQNNTLLWATNNDGELAGVICCYPRKQNKVMLVEDLITTERWVLKKFVEYFKFHYPDWRLEAWRRGSYVLYSTDKLCNKLMKG